MTNDVSKQERILEAARERFARYGFSKVTMDEIASDVEMGKASLYYYFPTKEDLFFEVIKLEQNYFKKEIKKILDKDISACNKLKEYVQKRLIFFQQLLNLGALNVHAYFDNKAMFKGLYDDFQKKELELIKEIIKEGQEDGEIKKELLPDMSTVFLHILQGLRLRSLSRSKDKTLDKEQIEELNKEMLITAGIFIKSIKNN
jgi:TetR/AcrR family transcriptional regulator